MSDISNKDEILANFQACTGIEDLGDAFTYLESSNWNLVEAINKVMPEQSRHDLNAVPLMNDHESPSSSYAHSFTAYAEQADAIELDSPTDDKPSVLDQYLNKQLGQRVSLNSRINENTSTSIASTSKSDKVLDINIKIKYEGEDSEKCPFPLEIPESTTLEELQTLLHHLLGIPPCSQLLDGFVKTVYPSTVITRDILPGNLSLTLVTSPDAVGVNYKKKDESEEIEEYNLTIRDEKHGKDYTLPYPATKLVTEIKTDMFHLTGIPARHQLWSGWTSEITDSSTLASVGVSKNHVLTLKQQPVTERTPKLQHRSMKNVGDASEENSSADEFEDASELLPEEDYPFLDDVPTTHGTQPLIPPDTEDEEFGVRSFVEGFQNRYGNCSPLFYHGTLSTALRESIMLPAKTRKPLAMYVHHDRSVSVNVFCSHSLCQVSTVDYLTNNFVIWGWDITHESNKNKLMKMVTLAIGSMAASTIKAYGLDKLPALLIFNKSRGTVEILTVIHGNKALDEVMTALIHTHEMFEDQRRGEVVDEDLREQRETVKAEQDAAYHESLEADRAKAIAKRKAELEERVERERQQSIKEQEDAMKEAVRASLEDHLPPEPDASCTEHTTVIRFRVPNGDPFQRTFTKKTRLQIVLNFLFVKGYPPNEYKCLMPWPRICITSLDSSKSLEEHNFKNQETLTVEERTDGQIE